MPESEFRKRKLSQSFFAISSFGIRASFGFRPSNFGLPPSSTRGHRFRFALPPALRAFRQGSIHLGVISLLAE